jgi:DNA processing protein
MSAVWEIGRGDGDYPPGLLELGRSDQPRLHGVGDRGLVMRVGDEPAVTIVGARRASSYGLRVAESLARDLALAGVAVVSGMALGIDSAAHRGALAGGGGTIAVLPGGPDRAAPPSNRELYERIAASGAVISEHPPGTRIEPFHFAHRNRIMAALGAVVVIVEAAQPSGSLITVDRALELGRTVAAVPGQVGVRVAEGTNALLRDGASLTRDARDVLDLLYGVGGKPPKLRSTPEPRAGPALDEELAAVLDLVRAGAATVDGLVAQAGLDPRRSAIALARLERLGYVRAGELEGYTVTGLPVPQ